MFICSSHFDHSAAVTPLSIIYSCAGLIWTHGGKCGHRDASQSSHHRREERKWTAGSLTRHTNGKQTLWLSKLVEDHDVVWIVEVFSQRLDVLTRQPVGHEDRRPVSVCPVDTILETQVVYCLHMVYYTSEKMTKNSSVTTSKFPCFSAAPASEPFSHMNSRHFLDNFRTLWLWYFQGLAVHSSTSLRKIICTLTAWNTPSGLSEGNQLGSESRQTGSLL